MGIRYILPFLFLATVGLGSVLFHGTLLRKMQFLDEFPMVWSNSCSIYTLLTMEDGPKTTRKGTIIIITAVTVFLTLYQLVTQYYLVFLVSFLSGTIYIILLFQAPAKRYPYTILPELSVILFGGGCCLWLLERGFCRYTRPFNFHAIWHIIAGAGTACQFIFFVFAHQSMLKREPTLEGRLPFITVVVADASDAATKGKGKGEGTGTGSQEGAGYDGASRSSSASPRRSGRLASLKKSPDNTKNKSS
jgi:dihydroceramidase